MLHIQLKVLWTQIINFKFASLSLTTNSVFFYELDLVSSFDTPN